MARYRAPRRPILPRDVPQLPRTRPRDYEEWKALVRWGKASPGEDLVIGYRLRRMREEAGLTQGALAERLGVSQQAVSQNERWTANPTWAQIVRWCRACGADSGAADLLRTIETRGRQ